MGRGTSTDFDCRVINFDKFLPVAEQFSLTFKNHNLSLQFTCEKGPFILDRFQRPRKPIVSFHF